YTSEQLGDADLVTTTKLLYQRVLKACGSRHLYRIWNHVPRINAYRGDLENYCAFCMGRSIAFENHFGAGFQKQLSAASAVGAGGNGNQLDLLFVAGDETGRHIENPEQM